ncbi:hypothetical protein AKAW_02334 [Aspergillus luchuensis IFO 4308]|nr:hypothetical protein AKAW_02334 [Aspergillus luchuensis IFO 4308]
MPRGASYDGDRLRRHKGGVDDEPITGAKIVNGHGRAPIMGLPVACSLQGPMARHHYLTFIVLPALIRRLLQMHGHESVPDHSFSPENVLLPEILLETGTMVRANRPLRIILRSGFGVEHAETTGTDVVAAGMLFRLMVNRDGINNHSTLLLPRLLKCNVCW